MKGPLLCITFLFFLTLGGQAQFFNNTLIKTRPLADFIGYNPTLIFEKPFGSKFSIEVDVLYHNRTWFSNGGEWNFGKFTPSTGFRIMSGLRGYVSKQNKKPFGWFVEIQFAADYSKLTAIRMRGLASEYENTKNIKLLKFLFIPCLGYQFHITKRISSEFYLGPALFLNSYRWYKIIDSPNPEEIGKTRYDKYPPGRMILPEFSWSIGYLLPNN